MVAAGMTRMMSERVGGRRWAGCWAVGFWWREEKRKKMKRDWQLRKG